MRSIIHEIITNKIPCYFISPHLDDAVFSAGSLMNELSTYTNVTVVNVFTKADNTKPTLSAKAFLKQCNYKTANNLFTDRVQEDERVLKSINVTIRNVGLIDALWRKRQTKQWIVKLFSHILPEVYHMYPTYRWHVIKGTVTGEDAKTVAQLKKKLSAIPKDSIVFCPSGLGNHVDHVLVRDICHELFPRVIYWSDFPYNRKNSINDFLSDNTLKKKSFKKHMNVKKKLISGYTSQFNAIFPDGKIPSHSEYFYYHL